MAMGVWGVVLTTAGSEAEAAAIATALIEAKLAACVNIFPGKSVYVWQGEIQRESEWQLAIKTRLACFEQVADKVRSLHSYEVPELIALPIETGSPDYLDWMAEQVAAPLPELTSQSSAQSSQSSAAQLAAPPSRARASEAGPLGEGEGLLD